MFCEFSPLSYGNAKWEIIIPNTISILIILFITFHLLPHYRWPFLTFSNSQFLQFHFSRRIWIFLTRHCINHWIFHIYTPFFNFITTRHQISPNLQIVFWSKISKKPKNKTRLFFCFSTKKYPIERPNQFHKRDLSCRNSTIIIIIWK